MRRAADPMRPLSTDAPRLCALAALALTAASCGGKDAPAPAPAASAASAAASAPAAPAPNDAPASPFSVALEAKTPLAFAGLAGGVWVGQATPGRTAQAAGGGELEEKPMPAGIAEGDGRIVAAAGRLPNGLWLSLEQPRPDGKPGPMPLYRLGKDGFKRFAEDWQPQIAAWSKNRLLSASTSSGRLKIKVIEPQLKESPPDLPAARFGDDACAQSLKLRQLAALPGGEVFAVGNCSPDGVQGTRYVVVRWLPPDAATPAGEASAAKAAAPAAPTPPAASASAAASAGAAPAAASAGATPAAASASAATAAAGPPAAASATTAAGAGPAAASPGAASDTGPGAAAGPGATGAEAGSAEGVAGTLFVIPGVERNLAHRALFVRSATEAYVAAVDEGRRASHLARFDGSAWAAEAAPPTPEPLQALSGTSDGTLWALTEHQIWRRPASGAWEQVPPPDRAFPEPEPSWQFNALWSDGAEVWVAGRHASKSDSRHVVLRTKAPRTPLRWP
ncbi:MAG TPA: hypothetical protein VFS43_33570 [Polyangiaceae bacterium]|nr:hypothetical protein [Polyangiaceae bacterium]